MPKIFGKRWGLRSSKTTSKNEEHPSSQKIEKRQGPIANEPDIIKNASQCSPPLIDLLIPDVEKTIQALTQKKFDPDPLAGKHFSRMVSLLSSSYKRHGYILEAAIREQLKTNPNFEVWADPDFLVSKEAQEVALSVDNSDWGPVPRQVKYGKNDGKFQVDVIVFDKLKSSIATYEIKRGHGNHDSGKRRGMRNEALCTEALLIDYAKHKGFSAKSAHSHVIFYYGKRSLPAPMGLIGDEIDEHFGMSIQKEVEEVNAYFQRRLFEILSN